MSFTPNWISKKALLIMHEESLAAFGGMRGLRDEGLLASVLARSQNVFAYNPQYAVADLAAAYAFGLTKNHAFVDGNKRAAFLSLGLFLAINGHHLKATPLDAIKTIIALAAGDLAEYALAEWTAANMEKT